MKDSIAIVSAGAGSGKTYRLADEVLKAIQQQQARPEAILLTTFTRKAAAELEERVRVRLLEEKAWEEAQSLRRAWIGTIDSICLRLLQEYAFEAGQSPELTVIAPGEDALEFNRSLTDTVTEEQLKQLDDLSTSLSIGGDYGREWDWRSVVKDIADAARSNRIAPDQLSACAERSLTGYLRIFPKGTTSAEILDDELIKAINKTASELQNNVDSGADKTKVTGNALATIRQFEGRLNNVHRIPWAEWARLSKLAVGKKSESLISDIKETASRHFEHPRLQDEIRALVRLMFKLAQDTLDLYQERKRKAGLLDFIDLEEQCLDLVANDRVRDSLRKRLDLVLIDELQDTSPIQLALFLKLVETAKRSVWVGDQKQSIFDFRGSDPVLMQSLLETIPPQDRLPKSYRSRPSLVSLVNQAFAAVFPNQGITEKVELQPHREETLKSHPCESWVLNTTSIESDAEVIADRIRHILDNTQSYPIVDRRSKEPRALRPDDICVLTRTNAACVALAHVIAKRGIPVELARPGLLASPEVILTLSALRLLLNPMDSLAAGQLTFLINAREDDLESWILPRLEEFSAWEKAKEAGGELPSLSWGGDPTLQNVLDHQRDYGLLSPAEVLQEAIKLSRAREMCTRWGEPVQRFANLEKLAALTEEYQRIIQSRGEASSIAGLLTYLYGLAADQKDEQALGGADAVRLSTYHRAKGMEWHMVILYQLNQEPRNWLFAPSVEPAARFDWENPLQDRWIRYWPWPYGRNRKGIYLDEAVQETSEYKTATTRAAYEDIRLLYVGMTRARDYLVFAARPGKHAWIDLLEDKQGVKTFELPQDEKKAGPSSPISIIPLTESEPTEPKAKEVTWFAVAGGTTKRQAEVIYCSNLLVPTNLVSQVSTVPEKILGRIPIGGAPDMTSLGNAVHEFLACDSSSLGHDTREVIAREILEAHGVIGSLGTEDLISIFDRFVASIHSRWPGVKIYREWPVAVKLADFELHGTGDIILETNDGYVLIDHKTFPGGEKELLEKAKEFAGQLVAYSLAIGKATGRPVVGTWIHFPVSGYIVQVTVNASPESFLEQCIRNA